MKKIGSRSPSMFQDALLTRSQDQRFRKPSRMNTGTCILNLLSPFDFFRIELQEEVSIKNYASLKTKIAQNKELVRKTLAEEYGSVIQQ